MVTRINQLPSSTGLTPDDLILSMDDPSGSKITKSITLNHLTNSIRQNTSANNDYAIVYYNPNIKFKRAISKTEDTYGGQGRKEPNLYINYNTPKPMAQGTYECHVSALFSGPGADGGFGSGILPGYSYDVKVATTGNITALSGLLTIDTVPLNNGDKVLIKNQITSSNNGIYTVSSGVWPRSSGLTDTNNLLSLLIVPISGSLNNKRFFCTNTAPPQFLDITNKRIAPPLAYVNEQAFSIPQLYNKTSISKIILENYVNPYELHVGTNINELRYKITETKSSIFPINQNLSDVIEPDIIFDYDDSPNVYAYLFEMNLIATLENPPTQPGDPPNVPSGAPIQLSWCSSEAASGIPTVLRSAYITAYRVSDKLQNDYD